MSDRITDGDNSYIPPAGWSGPDARGHMEFVMPGRTTEDPPALAGFEPYWIGVHGLAYTRWVYRPVKAGGPEEALGAAVGDR